MYLVLRTIDSLINAVLAIIANYFVVGVDAA
jgi:hypothetical protein